MKCPTCQHENPPQSKFCFECGSRLALTCGSCGVELPTGVKFCNHCGQAVGQSPAETRYISPQSYTPKHLAEKILTSKSALEGERKQVTVLFADLKGSMELLAHRDPEEARKILDPVLELMMEAVHRYEGTVNQVMGDGIMALFGAPIAHEDHAVRACYAALRMQEGVRKYAEQVRRSHAAVVKIRVGLNSGEVVVRAIGSDLHMDYTAVGQTTHLAARMEQLVEPGAIMITPATLALAEGYVAVASLGPVPVKGLPDPMEVYTVTGPGPVRTRLQAAARRGLTRFVGRDAELEQLRRVHQLADDGHGQVAAIVGEAGVGKSRLIYEFTHSHRLHDWLVLQSGSVSYGKATSYLPVIELLKGYFKIQDRDDPREIREKVTGKLLTLDRALESMLPALLALLDVPVDDAAWQALDPAQRRHQTHEALRRLVLREAREQPLLLIFEDLHWIDSETQAFLDMFVDGLGTARLLLLVNYRPEYQHPWGSKISYSQMRLDALPAESAGELLDAILGDDSALAALKQLLVKRGNPFFLEETVRTLVETKALEGERGAYRLLRPVQGLQIPATVQAILAARIDRLPAAEKQLLQIASVIGRDVPFLLLHGIAGFAEEALHRGLAQLQVAEFLYEADLFPDHEYSFKHALTHEVAYGSLLQERRKALHAEIVGAIECFYPARLTEHVEQLAHHAVQGEVWDKASTYLRQAGTKAAARSAYREAVGRFEQALRVLQHLPERRDVIEQAIDLRLDLRNSLHPLGEFQRTLAPLREAESFAEALGDEPRLGRISACLSQYSRLTENPGRAIESGERALAIATRLDDFPLQIVSNVSLGQAYRARGDYRRAIEALKWNVAALVGDRMYERLGQAGLPSVLSRTWLARSLAEQGNFAEGTTYAEEAVRIAEMADHPNTLVHAYFGLGLLCLHKGDVQKAILVLDRGLKLHRTWDLSSWFPAIASSLGFAYAQSGRVTEAVTLLEKAIEQAGSMKLLGRQSLRIAQLSEACILAGRMEEAADFAARALDFARQYDERGNQAWALRVLGEVGSRRVPLQSERAEDDYRQALALAEEFGMRPLVAHCHLGLGKLYRRIGKREEAQKHLATATSMYREMGMAYWLEKAETELRQ